MDIKTKIGLRIKEIRTEKELTQEAIESPENRKRNAVAST
jgi:hypothetical protein